MSNLRKQLGSCVDLALAALTWLTKAKRALTDAELQEVVFVEADRYELDEWDIQDRQHYLMSVLAWLLPTKVAKQFHWPLTPSRSTLSGKDFSKMQISG